MFEGDQPKAAAGCRPSMRPIDVIRLYRLCFKIELSFDQALRVLSFPEG